MHNGNRKKHDPNNAHKLFYANEDFYTICVTENITSFILKQQSKYLAHLIRSRNDSVSKKIPFNSDRYHKRRRYAITLMEDVLKCRTETAM